MRDILLRLPIRKAVAKEHERLRVSVSELEQITEEPVSLYDLLIAPAQYKDLSRAKWLELHEIWAKHLHGKQQPLDELDFGSFYPSTGELKIRRGLFPFLLGMQHRDLWITLTSIDPDPEKLVDLTRFTVYWWVLSGIKALWLSKAKTADWACSDYVGAPAVTYGVATAAATLFGEGMRKNMFAMKTLHTRIAMETGKSEIWVNTALEMLGRRMEGDLSF